MLWLAAAVVLTLLAWVGIAGADATLDQELIRAVTTRDVVLEMVAKPHKHFFNVTMTQASWKKATNILI